MGGDLEAITMINWDETSFFVGIERDDDDRRLIQEFTTSPFDRVREWNLVEMQGTSNMGLEGLTFVPDSLLQNARSTLQALKKTSAAASPPMTRNSRGLPLMPSSERPEPRIVLSCSRNTIASRCQTL